MEAIGRVGPVQRTMARSARVRAIVAAAPVAPDRTKHRAAPTEPPDAAAAGVQRMRQPAELVAALDAYRRTSDSAVRRMPAGYRTSKLV